MKLCVNLELALLSNQPKCKRTGAGIPKISHVETKKHLARGKNMQREFMEVDIFYGGFNRSWLENCVFMSVCAVGSSGIAQ